MTWSQGAGQRGQRGGNGAEHAKGGGGGDRPASYARCGPSRAPCTSPAVAQWPVEPSLHPMAIHITYLHMPLDVRSPPSPAKAMLASGPWPAAPCFPHLLRPVAPQQAAAKAYCHLVEADVGRAEGRCGALHGVDQVLARIGAGGAQGELAAWRGRRHERASAHTCACRHRRRRRGGGGCQGQQENCIRDVWQKAAHFRKAVQKRRPMPCLAGRDLPTYVPPAPPFALPHTHTHTLAAFLPPSLPPSLAPSLPPSHL